ncbi:MAG: Pup--protein ligase [Actinomycetaceae bacterium]|nr:Pup--protein ligase [Actinomycetaceae bacterium]
MFDRIFGIETEYGITCASQIEGSPPPLDAEHAARELFEPVVQEHKTSNVFLPNGGRLYLDVGSHPEYATAECRTLHDIIAQDNAGDLLYQQLLTQVNLRLKERDVPGRIHLLKNNVDSMGNSYGCHENYLLYRRKDFRQVADALVSFFITRQILVGAGYIDRYNHDDTSQGGRYCFSQRADKMWDCVSAASTRSRPIINTRDEPLADGDRYRRMHVIVGDSNISQATTILKIGMTLALLHVIDNGLDISDITLARPMQAIREMSIDTRVAMRHELTSGRTMTAVDIQQTILDRVSSHPSTAELDDPHMSYVFDLWQRGITALKTGDWSTIDTELDWAIKYRLLHDVAQKKELSMSSAQIARLDFAYHDLVDGLRDSLEQTGRMKRIVSHGDVTQATQDAPTNTRAYLRGKVLCAAKRYREDVTSDWYHLRIDNSQHPTITLTDPFACHDERIDELVSLIMQLHEQRHSYQVAQTQQGSGEVVI